jgi:hypothetical protein
MIEETLRNKVIRDLQAKKINVINFHKGTFDTLVDGTNPFLLEMKVIKETGRQEFKKEEPLFEYTEDQCNEIPKAKFPVYVLAKYDNDYFLFNPKWVRKHIKMLTVDDRYDRAIINEWRRNEDDVVSSITYDEAINNIAKIAQRKRK